MKTKLLTTVAVLAAWTTIAPSANAALIAWDATFFNDVALNPADYASFQSSINTTLNYYTTNWEVPNAITVKIEFHATNTGLGAAATFRQEVQYQDYRNALAATGTSLNDMTAIAFLPNSAANPVNSHGQLNTTLPLLRALGFPEGDRSLIGAPWDASLGLNVTLMQLDRSGPVNPALYDLQQVTYHELNEVLGFTSRLNGVPNTPGPGPSGPIQPADLFRYENSGVRSWNTDPAALQPYFSINNGVTKLAEFDVDDVADRQDFNGTFNGSPFFSVQDAFSTPGLRLDNALAERTFLDVIGYNAVPEPGSAVLLVMGTLTLITRRRKARSA